MGEIAPADCQSAKQQATSLRYEVRLNYFSGTEIRPQTRLQRG
jgi:hypothetical protein